MTTNYVGLSCSGHDNSLAIVNSHGELVFAEATERYLQNKRSLGCPPDDVNRVGELLREHCDPDASLVVARTWSAGASQSLSSARGRLQEYVDSAKRFGLGERLRAPLLEMCFISDLVLSSLSFAGKGIEFRANAPGSQRGVGIRAYDHHLTHAAAGCYSSPFSDAVCAVVDGYGEAGSCSFFAYKHGVLRKVDTGAPPRGQEAASLGLFYGDLCRWCGFDPWKGEEWKVMALASYGSEDSELYRAMSDLVRVDGLRLVRARSAAVAYLKILRHARPAGSDPLLAANLARTGQCFFTDLMSQLLGNLYKLGVSDNLVLGGGCALNSACNGVLPERTPFKKLHVFAAPADDGNSVGAAWLACREDHPDLLLPLRIQSPYVGSTLSTFTLENLRRFARLPGIKRRAGDPREIAAKLLAAGKIVGWVRGRAELGPRALGNRSILADPRRIEMKDRLNLQVKFREDFRPFAPAILHEHGAAYFENYQESPYMERTLRFRPGMRDRVPAVVHVDGTGRLESVKREWNPDFHSLLSAFHRLTGIPLLLNTSFNVMGRPIIHSAEDALGMFLTTGLDALVLEDVILEKHEARGTRTRPQGSSSG